MGLFQLFGTSASTILSHRIETMQSAESTLMSLAHNFGRPAPTDVVLETFDEPLDGPRHENCQMRPEGDGSCLHFAKCSGTPSSSHGAPLVLLHGYCNGALYFYRNFFGLQRHFGTVFALDLPGWGLSSRPRFTASSIDEAEAFYVERIEQWRERQNIPKMTLAGHSLGGYVAVAYAEKYPARVDRLVLISPVGVPHPDTSSFDLSTLSMTKRMAIWTAKMMWQGGYTPGSVIRTISEARGLSWVRNYVEKRLPAIQTEEERATLTKYLYTNAILPPSGEFSLNHLLAPFAYAHRPTVDRIPALRVSHVSFVYGEHDWMDPKGGLEVAARCSRMRLEKRTTVPEVEVYSVRSAGHLLMLENWLEFNSAVIQAVGGSLANNMPRPTKL